MSDIGLRTNLYTLFMLLKFVGSSLVNTTNEQYFLNYYLFLGTYYYLLTHKTRHGCSIHAYNLAFWITISTYICLQFSIIVFCWVLSTIFSLVYFKNKIVQYLAKSIRF